MAFRVLIIGGTGQVGAAVVRALAAEPSCAEVVMVNRKAISLTADPRLRQVILDTAAAQFPAEVTTLAQSMVAQGAPVYGASCVGVGSGSAKWSEEELTALEIGGGPQRSPKVDHVCSRRMTQAPSTMRDRDLDPRWALYGGAQ